MKLTIYLQLLLLLCYAEVNGNVAAEFDSLLTWKNYRFLDYKTDSVNYELFFNHMQNDFFPGGINLENDQGVNCCRAYIEIRDTWFSMGNLNNLRLSILLTRCILMLLFEYQNNIDKQIIAQDSTIWLKIFKNAKVNRTELFEEYDRIIEIKYPKWISLRECELNKKNTNAWFKYIKQAKLFYKQYYIYGGKSMILSESKSLNQDIKVSCFLNFIRTPDVPGDLQVMAYVTDFSIFVEMLNLYRTNYATTEFNIDNFNKYIIQNKNNFNYGLFLRGVGMNGIEAICAVPDLTNRIAIKSFWKCSWELELKDFW